MADACVFLMEQGIHSGLYNVGTGTDVTIRKLAEIVMDVVGFQGKMTFDTTKPDGTLRKLLDVSRMETLGWTHKVDLKAGVQLTYEAFRSLSLQ
jgi:GDP-L-fucose synthase